MRIIRRFVVVLDTVQNKVWLRIDTGEDGNGSNIELLSITEINIVPGSV
jgi:hypothetical protein